MVHPEHDATQIATQILDTAPSGPRRVDDIGKDVGGGTRELFVVCAPAEALRQQFEHADQPFVALHGLGEPGTARQVLAAIAKLTGWPLQRLVVRRQGFGNELATLTYLDSPVEGNRRLRFYATDVDASDPAALASVRRLLLTDSAMTAVFVTASAAPDLAVGFEVLRHACTAPGRSGRQVLVLPLRGRSDDLSREVDALTRAGARAEISPATTDPALAWALLATAWNRTSQQLHAGRPGGPLLLSQVRLQAATRPAAAATTAAPPPATSPAPIAVPTAPGPASDAAAVTSYLQRVALATQAHAACIFHVGSLDVLAHLGAVPGEQMARQGAALLRVWGHAGTVLGVGSAIRQCGATIGQSQVMLRAVPGHDALALLVIGRPGGDAQAWQQAWRTLEGG